jgi:serine/threonine-protein phosphatase 6 regulatory ankyrin repeat subunit B
MLASKNDHIEVIKCLLTEGVDMNVQANNGLTALMLASGNGHLEVVKCLLVEGVDINVQTNDGLTALMLASGNGHLEVVKCLLVEGVDINVQTNDGLTALMLASAIGHLEVVKCLLIKSADPNIQSNDNITALLAASAEGHYQIVEILLQNDADININDESPIFPTPLSVAIIENHIEVIHVLLAKISQHSINNLNKAMMTATVMNRHEVLRLLLEAGVNPNFNLKLDSQTLQQLNNEDFDLSNTPFKSILQFIPDESKDDPIKFILTFLQKVNIDRLSTIPLMQSALLGHIEIVDLLLKYNADPNAVDIEDIGFGHSALHMAAACNHPDIVDKLLSAGAQIDHQTNDGVTALMLASVYCHLEVIWS